MMRSFMYLRPGNLAKDFIIEQRSTSLSEIGRPKTAYQDDGNCMLKGVLAEADTRQKMRWEQLQHPITHTIVQTGKPMAKAEDKVEAYFKDKYEMEAEKEKQMKDILGQVQQYPKWREQSIERQKEFSSEINDLRNTQKEIIQELKDIEERRKKTKRNELRDRLLQSYRYYTSKDKNPLLAWSVMESDAFWKMFGDYEEAGGDGDMHTTVQPAMRLLDVIQMNEEERISELMQSRK